LLLFQDVWQEIPTSDFIRDILSVGLRLSFVLYTCGLGKGFFSLSSYFLYLDARSYMLLIHVFSVYSL
jgi:uncharacterized membrane protein YfhO